MGEEARLPITTAAALRDVHSAEDAQRELAAAYLAADFPKSLQQHQPLWRATQTHPQGAAIRAALHHLATDPHPALCGYALLGFARLGEPEVLPRLREILARNIPTFADSAPAAKIASMAHECAVMATGILAALARANHQLDAYNESVVLLHTCLTAPAVELRFQAAPALAECAADQADEWISEALLLEAVRNVREQQLAALKILSCRSTQTHERLAQFSEDPRRDFPERFSAAVVLSQDHQAAGVPVLCAALAHKAIRDEALEALAYVGATVPTQTLTYVRELLYRWSTPAITRVRAAYALARLDPAEGQKWLHRFTQSWRPSVRKFAHEAQTLLASLPPPQQDMCK